MKSVVFPFSFCPKGPWGQEAYQDGTKRLWKKVCFWVGDTHYWLPMAYCIYILGCVQGTSRLDVWIHGSCVHQRAPEVGNDFIWGIIRRRCSPNKKTWILGPDCLWIERDSLWEAGNLSSIGKGRGVSVASSRSQESIRQLTVGNKFTGMMGEGTKWDWEHSRGGYGEELKLQMKTWDN